ncbi:MAG TPA: DUF3817 domain-containing protein [Acidimicrobiales bacterium]|nr:DUF3817 domain-containing protein [Acidimicrobiales bacterium]
MQHAVLTRYRVMAYATAVLLIVLVFVAIPIQAAGHPAMAKIVGTMHGFLYCIYLFTAFELTRRLHVPIGRTLLVLLAGTVPFGAIVAERRLTTLYSQQERRATRSAADTSDAGAADAIAPPAGAPDAGAPAKSAPGATPPAAGTASQES